MNEIGTVKTRAQAVTDELTKGHFINMNANYSATRGLNTAGRCV